VDRWERTKIKRDDAMSCRPREPQHRQHRLKVAQALHALCAAQHHDGVVRATKADAAATEEHFDGKTTESPAPAKSTARRDQTTNRRLNSLARIADLHPTRSPWGFGGRDEAASGWTRIRKSCEKGAPKLVAPIVLGQAALPISARRVRIWAMAWFVSARREQ